MAIFEAVTLLPTAAEDKGTVGPGGPRSEDIRSQPEPFSAGVLALPRGGDVQ